MFASLCVLLFVSVEPFEYNGVVFGGGEWSTPDTSLGTASSASSLRAAVASGASSVRLIPTWYTDSSDSTTLYRNPTTASNAPFATESDAAVGSTMALAKNLGLKVLLSPVVDPNWRLPWVHRGSPGYPGAECLLWRQKKLAVRPANCSKTGGTPTDSRGRIGQFFSHRDWDAWFEQYAAVLLNYAALAQAHGADVLIVAAELTAAQQRPANAPRWTALLARVRRAFSGKLAVSQATNAVVPWAAAVDLLGFDMSGGLAHGHPVASPAPPTVPALAAAWAPYIAWLSNVSATTGKQIFASSLGFQSRPRSFMAPAGSVRFAAGDCSVSLKCVSMEDQRVAYEAFYTAFANANVANVANVANAANSANAADAEGAGWFRGVLWWLWRSDPSAGGTNDPSFTPCGKRRGRW